VSDVLWDNNFDTGQLWITPDWAAKLGVPKPSGPMVESHWRDLISPSDIGAALQSYNEALDSGATHWQAEYRMVGADGRTINMAVTARILRHSDGRAYRVLGSVRDVTALKRQQEGYTRARALEAVGQLTGGIAHDFNNLLMIILGNAELLEMSTLSDSDAERVSLINQAAENAATLTKRLLAFSGQTRLEASSVNMAALVDNMWPLLRAALPESISVTRSIPDDVWEPNVDANGLEQAILNLAMNAKDAMLNGGEISIACKNHIVTGEMLPNDSDLAPGRYVLLSFSDTGRGMCEEVLSKVFEPFFTTKEFGKGTGLGLSTVYGFVTQSGGGITIQSEEGRGTTVNLYLAASQGREFHDARTVVDTKGDHAPHQHRILAVEDQPEVRAHVEKLLTRLGYTVVSACDASSALEILKAGQSFDLLFTDIIMPGGMNGLELSKTAKEIAPQLEVLYTSGYPAAVFEELGVEDRESLNVLGKPYKAKQLHEAIMQVLGID
jgi:signal transduction histidine kinase/CheY-like chemotaxis protein